MKSVNFLCQLMLSPAELVTRSKVFLGGGGIFLSKTLFFQIYVSTNISDQAEIID
jgi:hypothetical protein